MIPEKVGQKTPSAQPEKSKVGTFDFFNLEFFIKKVLKNWYWFLLLGILGYAISYIYKKYYIQYTYESNISLSVSNNTASYLAPSNQSINFIWGQGGNQDGLYVKKLLLSRTHNEFITRKLELYIDYSTSGKLKSTFLDKNESPFFLEIDKEHFQAINIPITFIPKDNSYTVNLPEDLPNYLYSYKTEDFHPLKETYKKEVQKNIKLNEWYESPYFRFRLIKNPVQPSIDYNNITVVLSSIDQKVRENIGSINIEFDKEFPSIMSVSKRGANLNSTVNFLNNSIKELIEKRKQDKSLVDKNTVAFIKRNLDSVKIKLDSSAQSLNGVRIGENIVDVEGGVSSIMEKIKEIEKRKAELLTRISALNSIRNSMNKNLDEVININAAGIEDGNFMGSVSELKALIQKREEMRTIYTPNSEPMKEINRLIKEARGKSSGVVGNYYSMYLSDIEKLDAELLQYEREIRRFPLKEQKLIDAERGYSINETTYNALLSEQAKAEMRLAVGQSDITVLDWAKNLGQGPVGPNTSMFGVALIGGLLSIPFIILLISSLLDNKIRSVKEVVKATKIPLLGVIGKNTNENNLTVIEQSKSSVAESFRGVRSNLRFLYDDGVKGGKVILVTSSISGEGKTYTSINIASVLALSGKKTILLGMDLRKPKIFGDFEINNKYGISNFLTGEIPVEQIINKTKISTLDVATSGPIPPNPSELLMSERNTQFIEELRKS
ncbi:gliding motility protein [Riemerella anatipestifer]|nr:tyrosine-protein kinase [Riemerella anatipestifer]WKV53389.1 gliding motility protein [Riemerella anatipestifer]WKV55522.1 gliding motility protein [Riemerella anatipestifer]WKV57655.1 gliding motility protein [Riemerella anatipestifer]